MCRFLPLAVGMLAIGAPAYAASPRVEAAIAAVAKLEGDATHLAEFCRLNAQYATAGQDDAKNEAADRQMEAFLRTLGRDFIKAWELSEELDPESEDGKALDAAFDGLEDKCPE